jgi:hypothetical protein
VPVPGISLVGFMEEPRAMVYLQQDCIPPDPAPAALQAAWNTARGNLGAPIANAGNPKIADIPAAHAAYIDQVKTAPWLAPLFVAGSGWALRLVEIEPLLAFQFHIDTARASSHCAKLVAPVQLADVLPICLPTMPPVEQCSQSVSGQSIVIRSRSLNLRLFEGGTFQQLPGFAGIRFGPSLPLVQVARYNGRYYLRNGFHRVLQLAKLGVKEVPCLFRDVASPEELGLNPVGTFPLALLESGNPPTCGHFVLDRGHSVSLRTTARVITVSWAEHVVAED